jgi:hypothetical protein
MLAWDVSLKRQLYVVVDQGDLLVNLLNIVIAMLLSLIYPLFQFQLPS